MLRQGAAVTLPRSLRKGAAGEIVVGARNASFPLRGANPKASATAAAALAAAPAAAPPAAPAPLAAPAAASAPTLPAVSAGLLVVTNAPAANVHAADAVAPPAPSLLEGVDPQLLHALYDVCR